MENFSNRFLGFAIGALWGLLIATIASGVIVLAAPVLQGSEQAFWASLDPEKTYLLKLFYQMSLFRLF